jgi:hypothetical protein
MIVKRGNEKTAVNSLRLFNLFLIAFLFFAPKSDAHVEFACPDHFTIWLCMDDHFTRCYGFSGMAGQQGEIEL